MTWSGKTEVKDSFEAEVVAGTSSVSAMALTSNLLLDELMVTTLVKLNTIDSPPALGFGSAKGVSNSSGGTSKNLYSTCKC